MKHRYRSIYRCILLVTLMCILVSDAAFANVCNHYRYKTESTTGMVVEEGSVIAPAISKELDEEMSQGEAESVLSGLEDNPNRQLTEAEIAALFANL